MQIGNTAWYVPSLWVKAILKAIRVTITGVELDTLGKVVYIKSVDKRGMEYNDYATMFSDTRPVQYKVLCRL